mmetsp:Transcript_27391/g.69073  ORF Transcript_27391/g.69073 Transcript_27391/m.69073 type:complete len:299 (-) Transcript_27391:467-1363(-)
MIASSISARSALSLAYGTSSCRTHFRYDDINSPKYDVPASTSAMRTLNTSFSRSFRIFRLRSPASARTLAAFSAADPSAENASIGSSDEFSTAVVVFFTSSFRKSAPSPIASFATSETDCFSSFPTLVTEPIDFQSRRAASLVGFIWKSPMPFFHFVYVCCSSSAGADTFAYSSGGRGTGKAFSSLALSSATFSEAEVVSVVRASFALASKTSRDADSLASASSDFAFKRSPDADSISPASSDVVGSIAPIFFVEDSTLSFASASAKWSAMDFCPNGFSGESAANGSEMKPCVACSAR